VRRRLALSLPSLGVSSLDLGRLFIQAALFSFAHGYAVTLDELTAIVRGSKYSHKGSCGIITLRGMDVDFKHQMVIMTTADP
jgi:hypothetical protein